MAFFEGESIPYLHTDYYEFLETIANSELADDVASGGFEFLAPIQKQSFLYDDMGSFLIDNYEFLGGPDHCFPIQEQSFLYEDKGSSLTGYYELLESNATIQQVEDVAYGGSHHGIPIHNQRLAIKIEGENKCKRSFTEFVASFEDEGSYNFAAAQGAQTNTHELEMRNSYEYMGSSPTDYYGFLKNNATLQKVDDVANDGPDYYTENKRQRLVMKIEDENEWQRSFRELVALCQVEGQY